MSGPGRRKGRVLPLVALLPLVTLVLLLGVGCGGGAGEETAAPEVSTPTSGAAGPSSDSGARANENELVGQKIVTSDNTPAEFVEAYGKKPLVVLFYVPGNTDDTSVLQSLRELESSFEHYVFLMYDYKDPDAYGDLPLLLKVGYPPQVVLIDRNGVVQEVWNGYVDEGTLNQSLVNLDRA